MNAPKALATESERQARCLLLSRTHVAELTGFVQRIRRAKGSEYQVPNFDPLDGGSDAQVLFLLEAPGPKAVQSGFVSRDNPDETAKNFFLLNEQAGIARHLTVTWNAVPWYIGSGSKIRSAKRDDVREAEKWLKELLEILHAVRFVVFVGQKALHARRVVEEIKPSARILCMPHPSPMFVNRAAGNRDRVLSVLKQLAARMATSDA